LYGFCLNMVNSIDNQLWLSLVYFPFMVLVFPLLNVFLQNSHTYGLASLCIALCWLNVDNWRKALPQVSHLKFLSSVWVGKCLIKVYWWRNSFEPDSNIKRESFLLNKLSTLLESTLKSNYSPHREIEWELLIAFPAKKKYKTYNFYLDLIRMYV